ncbi:MAG: M24 family metallopeptidase [Bacteroidales bacterium]|nr:M24 family metallopeptidase [Bacteroidales bacterium]
MDCVNMLIEMRRQQPLYREESFPAIVAWQEHAAMPHYENCDKTNVAICGNGLLLIDTGGQYLDGTTDITRTIGIGQVSDAQRRDYTLVLKGHIRLAQAVFPAGTRGDQLDVLARMDLWRDGKTYLHGTSHGVGHYLGVHEGPQSVRMEHNPQALLPGMVFSNEPAIYLGGRYGIRHENCVLVRPYDVQKEAPLASPCLAEEQGQYLCLETLTWCYIDTKPLDLSLLNDDELRWLNHYNQQVLDTLLPHLNADEVAWLQEKCRPVESHVHH